MQITNNSEAPIFSKAAAHHKFLGAGLKMQMDGTDAARKDGFRVSICETAVVL
jgi:hypothetical protein